MNKRNLILAGLTAVILTVGITLVLPVQTRPQPASAAQASAPASFDHSNCQYPDRWSNPANGCDNSDPAVPECIKAADTEAHEQACISAFTAQNAPATTTPTPTPVTTPSNQCGGK